MAANPPLLSLSLSLSHLFGLIFGLICVVGVVVVGFLLIFGLICVVGVMVSVVGEALALS